MLSSDVQVVQVFFLVFLVYSVVLFHIPAVFHRFEEREVEKDWAPLKISNYLGALMSSSFLELKLSFGFISFIFFRAYSENICSVFINSDNNNLGVPKKKKKRYGSKIERNPLRLPNGLFEILECSN